MTDEEFQAMRATILAALREDETFMVAIRDAARDVARLRADLAHTNEQLARVEAEAARLKSGSAIRIGTGMRNF